MPVPLRISSIKFADSWPSHIIIHHTAENNYGFNYGIDNSRFQTGKYEYSLFRKTKEFNTNYHIIVEKIDNDYYPIISRPLFTKTSWPDIPEEYNSALHVAVYGDFESDIPQARLYNIMAFRVLNPISVMFRIPEKNILLHREVSMNEKETCPGDFFDKLLLVTSFRKYRRFKSIRRN